MAFSRCNYILHCSHERPALARHGRRTLESRALIPASRLRDLKAAPEDVEIEAIAPIERTARALQAPTLTSLSDDHRE